MKTKYTKKYLSEEEIDRIVVAQADDDDAWDEPILEELGLDEKVQRMGKSANEELDCQISSYASQ